MGGKHVKKLGRGNHNSWSGLNRWCVVCNHLYSFVQLEYYFTEPAMSRDFLNYSSIHFWGAKVCFIHTLYGIPRALVTWQAWNLIHHDCPQITTDHFGLAKPKDLEQEKMNFLLLFQPSSANRSSLSSSVPWHPRNSNLDGPNLAESQEKEKKKHRHNSTLPRWFNHDVSFLFHLSPVNSKGLYQLLTLILDRLGL